MTLPIRIETMTFRFSSRDVPPKQYSGKLKEKGTSNGAPKANEGPTRLRRGATRLLYRTSNDNLKRSRCTKMGVFSASDVIRKSRLIKVFTIQNCSQSVCLQNVLDKDGDSH